MSAHEAQCGNPERAGTGRTGPGTPQQEQLGKNSTEKAAPTVTVERDKRKGKAFNANDILALPKKEDSYKNERDHHDSGPDSPAKGGVCKKRRPGRGF